MVFQLGHTSGPAAAGAESIISLVVLGAGMTPFRKIRPCIRPVGFNCWPIARGSMGRASTLHRRCSVTPGRCLRVPREVEACDPSGKVLRR